MEVAAARSVLMADAYPPLRLDIAGLGSHLDTAEAGAIEPTPASRS